MLGNHIELRKKHWNIRHSAYIHTYIHTTYPMIRTLLVRRTDIESSIEFGASWIPHVLSRVSQNSSEQSFSSRVMTKTSRLQAAACLNKHSAAVHRRLRAKRRTSFVFGSRHISRSSLEPTVHVVGTDVRTFTSWTALIVSSYSVFRNPDSRLG